MRLILLRHGETVWNIDKRLQGHDNSPLSTRLNSEAAVAAIRRAMAKITHTSTSPGKAPMMAWKTSAATSNR